jgi:hypothetical protein
LGGRRYWGKLHTLAAAQRRELYPEWSQFQAARRQLDPDGVFQNSYLAQILGDLNDVPDILASKQIVTKEHSRAQH